MAYLQLSLNLEPYAPFDEIIIAQLAEMGFESFTQEEPILNAFIAEVEYTKAIEEQLNRLEEDFEVIQSIEKKILPKENWNQQWESNFEPISISDFCLIRAPFHQAQKGFEYELIIEPKMSFGTGHHQTTQLMVELLSAEQVVDKQVLDMGAGTGILGILADRMGAKLVDAIDIEEWAYENMLENAERNQCKAFSAYHGGLEVLQGLNHSYDLIIANINKNILFDQLDEYRAKLKAGGVIFLSGFFETDQVEFETYAKEHGMRIDRTLVKEDWTALKIV